MPACDRRGISCSDIRTSSPEASDSAYRSRVRSSWIPNSWWPTSPSRCRFHPRCPVAFERCGWTAEEVVVELKDLAAGTPEEGLFAGLHADSPLAFTMPASPPDAEAAIRRIIEGKAEEFRGLKAIQS